MLYGDSAGCDECVAGVDVPMNPPLALALVEVFACDVTKQWKQSIPLVLTDPPPPASLTIREAGSFGVNL